MQINVDMQQITQNVRDDIQQRQRSIISAGKAGLTDTMYDIKRGLKTEMSKSFRLPTRFTLNSPNYLKPNKGLNTSDSHIIWIKDDRENPGQTPADHYLVPQIDGGLRPRKPYEKKLALYGVLKSGEYTVPVSPPSGVRYNMYGNMSQGQIIQILTAFVGSGSVGRGSKGLEFSRREVPFPGIYVRKKVNPLPRGRRARGGTGGTVQANRVRRRSGENPWKPVLAIINYAPFYSKRYSFYEYVNAKYHRDIDRNIQRRLNMINNRSRNR